MGLEWRNFRVEDIAAEQPNALATGPFGSAISAKFFVNEGVPVIRGSNLSTDIGVRLIDENMVFVSPEKAKEFSRSLAKRGDLVFTCWGTISQVGLIDEKSRWHEYIVSNKQMKLTVDPEKANSTYIYYVFSSPEKQQEILSNGIGAAVPGFNLGQLKKHMLRLPPLETQEAIVRRIQSIDDKIDLNRRINQTLEAMAQAIFKSWFVDFDPVKAKIAAIDQGEDPLRAAMRAISGKTDAELDQMPRVHHDKLAVTATLFPDAMEESVLGEVPKGWKIVPASALIEFNPKEPLRKGTVTPYLDMASLPTSGSWAESPVLREFGNGMRFRNGDALLARITPCLENGKSAFIQNLPDESVGWGSTEFIVMRSKKPVPQEYAYLLVRHAAFREYAIRSMTGTSGRQRAQAGTLAEFKVISPSENSVWCAFSELLGSCFKAIKSQSEASETLAELRDTLLPKLLSGELSVANLESMR